jgi:hypothetical protein
MRPSQLAFALCLAAGPARPETICRAISCLIPRTVIWLSVCDGETSIEVKGVKPGDQLTREQGQAIADTLMKEWRSKHPDAEWVVAAAELPAPGQLPGVKALGQDQFQTYGAFTERDQQIWKESTDRLVAEGSAFS